ncbi:MAG: fused MFS/spermidine synthase [Armatimonadota bacterium]
MTALIYLLFLASGAAGLIYEVIWMRMLMRILGATVLAYTIVLSAFMLGLALGGWGFGRRIDRRGNPLLVYAGLETGVALWAIALHPLSGLLLAGFAYAASAMPSAPFLLDLLRGGIAFAALLLPTTLMGGTLPVLTRFLVQRRGELGGKLGGLYAVNTAGAILGTGAAGFALVGSIGETRTTHVAVILNLAAAAGALFLALSYRRRAPGSSASDVPRSQDSAAARPVLVLIASAVTGFAILAYEVLWTRTGVLLAGNTTYSFSLMLLCFLTGIALGSAAMSALLRSSLRFDYLARWRLFAGIECLIGLVALASFASPVPVVAVTAPIWDRIAAPLAAWLSAPALPILVLLAPLTLLSGASFPLAASLYARDDQRVGGAVGSVYLWNTVGAAAGSAAAGLLLLPRLGITHSYLLVTAIIFAAGVLLISSTPAQPIARRLRPAFAWCLAGGALLAIAFPATGGLDIPRLLLRKRLDRPYQRCIFYQEDINGIVSVWQNPNESDPWINNKRLYIDAQPMAVAYRYGMIYERLQAHYPLLLHPDPKDVLVICLGTGTTLGSVGRYPVSAIDCVELSPAVVDAGVCFTEENHNILKDPRLTLNINDGRNYLLTTRKTYDVITAEPMHPHLAGTVNLYTREYFELVRSRLRPGGVCSHWIPVHRMRPQDVTSAIQAFREVFPHTLLFLETGDLIVLGSDQPLRVDAARWRTLLADPHISGDLAEVGLSTVPQLLATYMMDDAGIASFVDGSPAVTDDLPTLEFYGSYALSESALPGNVRSIVSRRQPLASLEQHLVGRLTPEEEASLETLYPLESNFLLAYADFVSRDLLAARAGFVEVLAKAPEDKRAAIQLRTTSQALAASGW